MIQQADRSAFSLAQARHIVKDLFTPKPLVYWVDFLLSVIGGMICFRLVRRDLTPFSIGQGIVFVTCCLLFYRATLFTHELTHLRAGTFRGFRVAWNLLCGIPFLIPSFMYYSHIEHHTRKHFGTEHDGEYLPLAKGSPWRILVYLCQPFVLPLIAVARFSILTPISWASPAFRRFVHRRASSMVMDPGYIRPLPSRKVLRIFRLQEALCFLYLATFTALLIVGVVPLGCVPTAYLVSVAIMLLNNIRTLGAHRYTNAGGDVTFLAQLLDSINYSRHPFLTSLWAPVGLRFHALHHLFPSLPYHNLAKAHERLMAQLPADSPYRLTESPSLTASLVQLWRASRGNMAKAAGYRQVHRKPQMSPAPKSLTGAHS
ncbi:MAG: fatty acid desaturase [Pirellulales bacterium]